MLLLAKETAGAILSDAALTIVTGLVVVFFVLLLLVFVFKAFGVIMTRLEKGEKATETPAPVAAAVAAPVVGNTEPVSTNPEIQNGIADETVAAISGVIACMAPAGKQYAVRRIMKK